MTRASVPTPRCVAPELVITASVIQRKVRNDGSSPRNLEADEFSTVAYRRFDRNTFSQPCAFASREQGIFDSFHSAGDLRIAPVIAATESVTTPPVVRRRNRRKRSRTQRSPLNQNSSWQTAPFTVAPKASNQLQSSDVEIVIGAQSKDATVPPKIV